MIVRDFKLTDLDQVLAIEYESFTDPYPSGVLVHLYEAGAGFIVAEVAGRVVAFVIFWILDGKGHIIVIAVDKRYQKMHIGTTLLSKVKQIIFSNNINTITLEVRKSNLIARKFYLSKGFKEVSEEDGYYGDGEGAVLMEFTKR